MTIGDILTEIRNRIAEHYNTAEEYYQELDSPEKGDQELAKAESLESIMNFIIERMDK